MLLAAAGIAPLHAASPQANIASVLSAPAAAPSTLQSRIAANPSLAQIPAGNDFINLSNLPQFTQSLIELGFITPEDMQDLQLSNMTYATNLAENMAQMDSFFRLCNLIYACATAAEWSKNANEAYAPALSQLGNIDQFVASPEATAELAKAIKDCHLAPTYITANLSPNLLPQLQMLMAQLPILMSQAPEGVKFQMNNEKLELAIPLSIIPPTEEIPAAIAAALAEKTIYCSFEIKGDLVMLAFGTEPGSLQWAASPEQSVLATSESSIMDAQLSNKTFLTANLRKESSNVMTAQNCVNYTDAAAYLFTKLGAAVPANQAIFDSAAAAIKQFGAALLTSLPKVKEDTGIIVWFDKGFYAECSMDFAANYVPSNMASINTINEQTIFTIQSSGYELKGYDFTPVLDVLPNAASIAEAVCCTLKPEKAQPALDGLAMLKLASSNPTQAPQELQSIMVAAAMCAPSATNMAASMGSSFGMTFSLNATPNGDESVVAFAELRDKKKFVDGFAKIYATISATATQLGDPIPPVDMEVTEAGPVTSYTIGNGDDKLQASLSNKCITISNMPEANVAMQGALSAGTGTTLAGAVIYCNLKNFATVVDKYELNEDCEGCGEQSGQKCDVGPFRDLIITLENKSADSTKGNIKFALPLQ